MFVVCCYCGRSAYDFLLPNSQGRHTHMNIILHSYTLYSFRIGRATTLVVFSYNEQIKPYCHDGYEVILRSLVEAVRNHRRNIQIHLLASTICYYAQFVLAIFSMTCTNAFPDWYTTFVWAISNDLKLGLQQNIICESLCARSAGRASSLLSSRCNWTRSAPPPFGIRVAAIQLVPLQLRIQFAGLPLAPLQPVNRSAATK